jgi:hypothetical protein
VLELVAKCDISSVSKFQNYNQQIEAISNRIGRLEESVSSSLWKLRTDCEAKLADMKTKRENDNETVIARVVGVERKVTEITGRLSICETDLQWLKPAGADGKIKISDENTIIRFTGTPGTV